MTSGAEPQPAVEASDDRDAVLLRQLVRARSRPDGVLREQLVITELLSRHESNIRRIVRWRAYSRQPSTADVDEIVNGVLIRVAEAVGGEFDPELSFGALVSRNLDWEVIDWVRRRDRRARDVHAEADDVPALDAPTLAEEARELRVRIAGLAGREREIVSQRMLLGFKPEMIAEIHGISRGAVDTATSRALAKLRASDELADERDKRDVRNPPHRSEGRT